MKQRIAATWIVAGALAYPSTRAFAAPPLGEQPEDGSPAEIETSAGDTEPSAEPSAQADPFRQTLIDEAAAHFVEGRRLFTARDFVDAAVEFERSYSAYPSGEALYNIALSYEKGAKPVEALQACDRYLALEDCASANDLHCARKRDEVTTTRARLYTKVGVLDISVEPGVELAAVQVDGVDVPLDGFPMFLEPGTITLQLIGAEEGQLRSRTATLRPGERTSVSVGPFVEAPSPGRNGETVVPPPELPPAVDPAVRQRRLRIAFWSGLGLTAGSGVSIAVLGSLTTLYKNRYDDRCRGEGVDCSDSGGYPEDQEATFNRLKPATNAMIGVTAGLGMVTAIVGIFAFTGKSGPSERASTTQRRFGLGANQLQVRW